MKILMPLAAALTFWGCFESIVLDCVYTVHPYIQEAKGDPLTTVDGNAVGYAFYADTALWAVVSYDDALSGTITHRVSGEKRGYDMAGERGGEGALTFRLTRRPVILTVCDPVARLYGWRHAEVQANLDAVVVPIYFRPWSTAAATIDSRWTMINEFPAAPDPEE